MVSFGESVVEPAMPQSLHAGEYVLEPIHNRAKFMLYRARQRGNPMPLPAVAHSPPSFEAQWAAKPLALARHEGRTILKLAAPGSGPLDLDSILEPRRTSVKAYRGRTDIENEGGSLRASG